MKVNVVSILNWIHRRGWYKLLCAISTVIYFIKGYGIVKSTFHSESRAYHYKVKGTSYLCIGPGWAYTHDYLKQLLIKTFCFYYLPKNGDCVIDIGAGLGEESVIFSSLVGSSGKVISIEANPHTFSGLKYLCDQNDFQNVFPLNLAIYSKNGEVLIEDNEQNYLKNTIGNVSSSIKVKSRTIDTLVNDYQLTKIDFLKVNIEGAEQFLIEGMSKSLPLIKNLCISCHDFRHIVNGDGEFYLTKERVKKFLVENGFDVIHQNISNHYIDDYVYATNKSLT